MVSNDEYEYNTREVGVNVTCIWWVVPGDSDIGSKLSNEKFWSLFSSF